MAGKNRSIFSESDGNWTARLRAEKKIEAASRLRSTKLELNDMRLTELPESLEKLTQLQSLDLSGNHLAALPEWLCNLAQLQSLDVHFNKFSSLPLLLCDINQLKTLNLSFNAINLTKESVVFLKNVQSLDLSYNQLIELPDTLGQLTELQSLNLEGNKLVNLPESFGMLTQLQSLNLEGNKIVTLPESIGKLTQLNSLNLHKNQLTDIPSALISLKHFEDVIYRNDGIKNNPLNPELSTAYKQGLDAVKTYLRAKAVAQINLNEAKLLLIGEGEVGKSCLLSALRDDPWEEGRPTTHGIEIKPVKVTEPDTHKEITLNGWDFGGQPVYRPTHQLFFSAPAIYLVVWKPREGPQQGSVKEWIQLVKHRAPDARILVVATHGGPQKRRPDIDRQELWDLFGKDMVVDFFHVESNPHEEGGRRGIKELKLAIARVAAALPEVGRPVPRSFVDVRTTLQDTGTPYLSLDEVIAICRAHNMDDEIAHLFITISHRLGHLTHYENDPTLRDIVILRPDWLATAMSYVLDDEETRAMHGLVKFSHLGQLWNDTTRELDTRYPASLHPIFLRLMERFDLSYRVADPATRDDSDPLSLIGQLVPNNRPKNMAGSWLTTPAAGDLQQTQVCRIVDGGNGQSASAEGLFYQLIVRLHKYSLGRVNYNDSVHWQRGLVLDDDYNGRALLENIGNDVRITVRAPYPERFLAMLTEEVKYLVESFWEGLRCDVTVPCLNPIPCIGLFEVRKLIENMKRGRPEQPCPICNKWQSIDKLLHNAPAAQPDVTSLIFAEFAELKVELAKARGQITYLGEKTMGRFDRLDDRTRRTLSRVDKTYSDLIQIFTDEAKEGPRLFSIMPVELSNFNPKKWIRKRFVLTLWCEHSRLPLPALNRADKKKGVYDDIELEHEWFKKAAPYLKLLTGTLSLVLPLSSSILKVFDEKTFKALEDYLDLSNKIIEAIAGEETVINDVLDLADKGIRADGAILRELHALLKAKDPSFGGLVRVMNKRQEFLWVHEQFAGEY